MTKTKTKIIDEFKVILLIWYPNLNISQTISLESKGYFRQYDYFQFVNLKYFECHQIRLKISWTSKESNTSKIYTIKKFGKELSLLQFPFVFHCVRAIFKNMCEYSKHFLTSFKTQLNNVISAFLWLLVIWTLLNWTFMKFHTSCTIRQIKQWRRSFKGLVFQICPFIHAIENPNSFSIELIYMGNYIVYIEGMVAGYCSIPMPQKRIKFVADHPFGYFIRENRDKTIIFSGRIENIN